MEAVVEDLVVSFGGLQVDEIVVELLISSRMILS
jgi:hypothetical protein